jgi:pilus assembly protein Flp/PilA
MIHMMQMLASTVARWLKKEDGAVAIEYVMLAVLIAIAFLVGATALGTALNNIFQGIADFVNTNLPIGGGGGS